MPRAGFAIALLCLAAVPALALPSVDGRVDEGEYARSISVLDGSATIYFEADGHGGLYAAVVAETEGWVGLGLGSQVMDGASIFMGFVKDGKPYFSEQLGSGHGHGERPSPAADASAVSRAGGATTLEFHVPAENMPASGPKVDYIVAYSTVADWTAYHESSHDSGSFTLP